MKKFLILSLGVFNCLIAHAVEKFEVLPDLPDPLAYAVQPASASTVSGTTNTANAIASQSIGQGPSIVSVVWSLGCVVLLIFLLLVFCK